MILNYLAPSLTKQYVMESLHVLPGQLSDGYEKRWHAN